VLIEMDILLAIFGARNEKILILQINKMSMSAIVPCRPIKRVHVVGWGYPWRVNSKRYWLGACVGDRQAPLVEVVPHGGSWRPGQPTRLRHVAPWLATCGCPAGTRARGQSELLSWGHVSMMGWLGGIHACACVRRTR
jgi:hypothetical protein